MTRLSARALAASLLALAAGSLARAEPASGLVNYFLPVTYQMVVSREGATTITGNRERTNPDFQLFGNRDLLALILGDEPLRDWALVARGNSADFGSAPQPFTTLRLAARNRRTGEVRDYPGTFEFTLLSARSVASTEVRESVDGAPGDAIRGSASIAQTATLLQSIPGEGSIQNAIGQLAHGTFLAPVNGASDLGPVLRPTAATFRASGSYDSEGEAADGMVELLISFGTPSLVVVETD